MKVLELFAGSRSIGKVCDKLGYDCYSVDWKKYEGVNMVVDIEFLDPNEFCFIPDIIWASPDCTTYSLAAISHHRNGVEPKSVQAEKSDRVIKNTLEIIKHFLQLNPDLKFYIENPVGMLRKMPFMKGIPKATVTYCQYGDSRMKPTDIFTNNLYSIFNPDGWHPRAKCNNGDKCHESAPRGSKTGTQGLKGSYERSVIPAALCMDVLTAGQLNKAKSG